MPATKIPSSVDTCIPSLPGTVLGPHIKLLCALSIEAILCLKAAAAASLCILMWARFNAACANDIAVDQKMPSASFTLSAATVPQCGYHAKVLGSYASRDPIEAATWDTPGFVELCCGANWASLMAYRHACVVHYSYSEEVRD